jgi:acetyltransferase
MKDVTSALTPVTLDEARGMIKRLRSYKMIQGTRGQEGVDEEQFAQMIWRLSALLEAAPEITEMDLNPLLGTPEEVVAVDARINIRK